MNKRPSVDIAEKQWRERYFGIGRKYFTEDELRLISDHAITWSGAAREDCGKMGVEFSLKSLNELVDKIRKMRNEKESK